MPLLPQAVLLCCLCLSSHFAEPGHLCSAHCCLLHYPLLLFKFLLLWWCSSACSICCKFLHPVMVANQQQLPWPIWLFLPSMCPEHFSLTQTHINYENNNSSQTLGVYDVEIRSSVACICLTHAHSNAKSYLWELQYNFYVAHLLSFPLHGTQQWL